MTVLDAYAVIAYLRGETAADGVMGLLRTPTTLSAANAAEVMDQLIRIDGNDPDDVEIRIATLIVDGMRIAPVTDVLGRAVGALRAKHYNKKTCSISLADCFAAATAIAEGTPLATSDPHLLDVMKAEKASVVRLPPRGAR